MGHLSWQWDELQILIAGYAVGELPDSIADRLPLRSVAMVKYRAQLLKLGPPPPRPKPGDELLARRREERSRAVAIKKVRTAEADDSRFHAAMRAAIELGAETAKVGVSVDTTPFSPRAIMRDATFVSTVSCAAQCASFGDGK